MKSAHDFELGGALRVRLLDAGPDEQRAVARQLGLAPAPAALAESADLTLRFVERIPVRGALRAIGLEAAFDDEAFFIVRGKHKSRVFVQVPLERVGAACELLCERGCPAVPMLVPFVNATLLAKGFLPLHAAAFEHRGRGVVATGWSKGGKTETLLAFLAQGARYIADEWLYLGPGGARMFGIPEPIRVWGWHVESLPELRARLTRGERARLALLGWAAHGMRRMTADGRRHRSAATRTLQRASVLLEGQTCLDLAPARLDSSTANGARVEPPTPDRLFFVVSHERAEIEVTPLDPLLAAERMRFSLAEEDQRLTSLYHKFRFAFPERVNPFLEERDARRRTLLGAAFADRRAYEVRHPYPVALPALYAALAGVVD